MYILFIYLITSSGLSPVNVYETSSLEECKALGSNIITLYNNADINHQNGILISCISSEYL